jgi:hypothetical protein
MNPLGSAWGREVLRRIKETDHLSMVLTKAVLDDPDNPEEAVESVMKEQSHRLLDFFDGYVHRDQEPQDRD